MKTPLILFSLIVVLYSSQGFAQASTNDDDDSTASVASTVSLDRAKQRAYPGGRDEQELTVQTALPQPTRSLDGTKTVVGDVEEEETTPGHD